MTTSDYRKVFKQLNAKPVKKAKYEKFNSPRKKSCGIALRHCKNCGRLGAHIAKYGLHLCRHCFREMSVGLGFKKFG
ncbi:30S ribosomal protein S14 [Candidatus Woesearchaeota archaeon]|nr:30S ribosomal protein S14 [Candidatus Woesearchaeota archaeon]